MKIYLKKINFLIYYINWVIILPIVYFLHIQNSDAQKSITTNSHIYQQSSISDLAIMYTNIILKDRKWDELISSFTDEYFLSLEGTSNEIPREKKHQIKKLMSQKFPVFYKKTFVKAILKTTTDKKFLFLLYCSTAGMSLTDNDVLYIRNVNSKVDFMNSFENNFRRIYRAEMKLWIKSLYN